jgi:hypothetical protein
MVLTTFSPPSMNEFTAHYGISRASTGATLGTTNTTPLVV